MKLFVVVEAGDDHVSLVDGERFETLHRFRSREALRGAPRLSPDGRLARRPDPLARRGGARRRAAAQLHRRAARYRRAVGDLAFDWNGTRVLALPNPGRAAIEVIDLRTWQPVKTIATAGPASFVRSHDASRYAWTDATIGANTDATLTLIDKQTLQPVARLRQPGHSPVHAEFTQDGRHALARVREPQGALIVHDATTRRQVKRLPMRSPAASYNVGNQLGRPDPGHRP